MSTFSFTMSSVTLTPNLTIPYMLLLYICKTFKAEGVQETTSSEPQLVVWGTDVAIAECREKFIKFIQRFVEPTAMTNEPLYELKLEEVLIAHYFLYIVFYISFQHLALH